MNLKLLMNQRPCRIQKQKSIPNRIRSRNTNRQMKIAASENISISQLLLLLLLYLWQLFSVIHNWCQEMSTQQ